MKVYSSGSHKSVAHFVIITLSRAADTNGWSSVHPPMDPGLHIEADVGAAGVVQG